MSGVPLLALHQEKQAVVSCKALRVCGLWGFTTGLAGGQRASAFAQGYGATRRSKGQKAEGRSRNDEARMVRAGLALNDEGMTQARMTNSRS